MTLDVRLTNDNLINFAKTDDAHQAFVNSVNNGQTRLALEVLAVLVDGLVDKINELEDLIANQDIKPNRDATAPQSPLVKPKSKPIKGEAEPEEVAVSA